MHKAISLTATEFLHAWCLLDECHSYWNPVLKLQNVKCLILDTQFNIKACGLMWFSYLWLTNQTRKKLHLSSPQAGLLRPFILQMNYSKVVVLLCNFLFYVVNPGSISESPWQKNQKTILQNLKHSISLNLYMPLERHTGILGKPKKETCITEKYAPNPPTSSLMSYWQHMVQLSVSRRIHICRYFYMFHKTQKW